MTKNPSETYYVAVDIKVGTNVQKLMPTMALYLQRKGVDPHSATLTVELSALGSPTMVIRGESAPTSMAAAAYQYMPHDTYAAALGMQD